MKKAVILTSVLLPCALGALLLGPLESERAQPRPHAAASTSAETALTPSAVEEAHRVALSAEGAGDPRDPDELLLLALGESLAQRDGAAAGAAINAFLSRGPAAVDELMRRLEQSDYEAGMIEALGSLLQGAATLAHNDPGLFSPWTLESIAQTAVGLIGSGAGAARVLELGLAGLGADLEPSLMQALVAYHDEGGREIGDLQHQMSLLRLMQGWARDMPAALEQELLATLRDPARHSEARNRGAQLLLARDWRRFAPELTVELELGARSGLYEEHQLDQLRYHLGTQLAIVSDAERFEYLIAIAGDVEATSNGISQLEPYEATQLLALATPEQVGERAYLELLVHADAPEALEAGLELLPHYSGSDYSQRLLLSQLLLMDGGYHPGVMAELESRFTSRQSQADPLWGTFTINSANMSDRQLADAALPFLERTRGEQHPSRTRLVSKLEQRFPTLAGVY